MMHENTDVANSGADDYTEASYHPKSERGLLTPVCSENLSGQFVSSTIVSHLPRDLALG